MSDFKKLYTVDDVAKMFGLTSRTIRTYIKNGLLQGTKVGGQWRFTEEDLGKLLKTDEHAKVMKKNVQLQLNSFINSSYEGKCGETNICTIIDHFADSDTITKLSKELIAVINTGEYSGAKFNFESLPSQNKARFILYGSADYIEKSVAIVKQYSGDNNENK